MRDNPVVPAVPGESEERLRPPKFGDLVRANCGATGRYVGAFGGRHLVLYVSASDNSLGHDEWKPGAEPWERSPRVTLDECSAFVAGARSRVGSP